MKKKPVPEIKLYEDCKTDAERIDWLKKRVAELEDINDSFQTDGRYAMYYAENRKHSEIAKALNSFILSMTVDDKSFDRFIALQKALPDLNSNLESYRKQYLKKDEEQLKVEEANGIPLIERMVGKSIKS